MSNTEFRETFIIRTEWATSIFQLDAVDRAIILDNLLHFHMGNEHLIILNNLPVKLVWGLILPNLCRNIDSYDKRRETSIENGKRGGRPKGSTKNLNKPKSTQEETHYPNETLSVSDTVIVSDSVSGSDTGDPPAPFVSPYAFVLPHTQAKLPTPELEEVKMFFVQNGISDDTAERFFNRYEATGWMIGGAGITNWRAVARTWIMEPNKFKSPPQATDAGEKTKMQSNIAANQTAKDINRKMHESANNNSK